MSEAHLTRRAFVRLSSAALATAVYACGGGSDGNSPADETHEGIAATCALSDLEAEPEQVRAVGELYAAETMSSPDDDRAALLATLREGGIDTDSTSTEEVAEQLLTTIDEDWRAGRSVIVDGWILSTTEARLTSSALASGAFSC